MLAAAIIPQQETLGNYNGLWRPGFGLGIIPQQETLGNYNSRGHRFR